MSPFIEDHKKIRKKLNEVKIEADTCSIPITDLAYELGMDPRTVDRHLKAMEIDEVGKVSEKGRYKFFTFNKCNSTEE